MREGKQGVLLIESQLEDWEWNRRVKLEPEKEVVGEFTVLTVSPRLQFSSPTTTPWVVSSDSSSSDTLLVPWYTGSVDFLHSTTQFTTTIPFILHLMLDWCPKSPSPLGLILIKSPYQNWVLSSFLESSLFIFVEKIPKRWFSSSLYSIIFPLHLIPLFF